MTDFVLCLYFYFIIRSIVNYSEQKKFVKHPSDTITKPVENTGHQVKEKTKNELRIVNSDKKINNDYTKT